jgi:hypothetical protein
VIEKEKDKERFLVGRDGDHLMNPFQCELCHFRNIQGRNPNPHSKADQDFLEHFRRVSLDVFWSREESTGARLRLSVFPKALQCQDYNNSMILTVK